MAHRKRPWLQFVGEDHSFRFIEEDHSSSSQEETSSMFTRGDHCSSSQEAITVPGSQEGMATSVHGREPLLKFTGGDYNSGP